MIFFFKIETSSDVYEMVAHSMLRSSWISNYLCPMLEKKSLFWNSEWSSCVCQMCWRHNSKFSAIYKAYKQLLHVRDLQILGVRSRCLAWSSSPSERSFEGSTGYLEILSLSQFIVEPSAENLCGCDEAQERHSEHQIRESGFTRSLSPNFCDLSCEKLLCTNVEIWQTKLNLCFFPLAC